MDTLDDKIDTLTQLLASIDSTSRGGLDSVQALRLIEQTAQSALHDAVQQARTEGSSWDSIGKALGTSRQSAWERYGPL